MLTGTKLRVAAYCRVSTDKDGQADSLAGQRRYFEEYIRRHEGWTLVEIFYDEGISGTQTKNRAGFNAMLELAEHGGVDLILTKEVCRFARNTVDALFYTRRLKSCGVGVVFAIDNIDTREPDGELRLTIMAAIAQEESRKTSERVKWGQKRRMEQGVVFGRNLMGYMVKNGALTVNEEEAPVVRAIFRKYTDEGKGVCVIARELDGEGIKPMRGRAWSGTAVLRALRNEKYVGDLCQKKTFTPDYLTHAKKYNRGDEEKVYLRNHHEPIIERELWERTQAELSRRSKAANPESKYSNRYWCSGKIYCGICRRRFVSRTKKLNDGGLYKAWRCYAAANRSAADSSAAYKSAADSSAAGRGGCDGRGCKAASVNERVLLACMHRALSMLRFDAERLKKEILRETESTSAAAPARVLEASASGILEATELAAAPVRVLEATTSAAAPEAFYGAILDKIVVYPQNMLEVRFRSLPFFFRFTVKTRGRGDNYTVDVVSADVIRTEAEPE